MRFRACPGFLVFFYVPMFLVQAGEKPVPPPPVDPMLWSPPTERPALRQSISDEAYVKRAQELLPQAEALQDEVQGLPEFGLEIDKVTPGTQADRAGIRPGHIILALDGRPQRYVDAFGEMRTGTTQQLTVYSRNEGIKTIPIEPGLLGVFYYMWTRRGLAFPASMVKNTVWRRDLLVASLLSEDEPEVAETALARAIATGMPLTAKMDEQIALVLLRQFKYAEAMDSAWFALQAQPTLVIAAEAYFKAAMASYKLDAALDALNRYKQLDSSLTEILARLVREHHALPEAERIRPLPSIEAMSLFHDDLPLRHCVIGRKERDHERAFQGEIYQVTHNARYYPIAIHHPVANVIFQCQFSTRVTETAPSNFLRYFAIGVVDMTNSPATASGGHYIGMAALLVTDRYVLLVHPRKGLDVFIKRRLVPPPPDGDDPRFHQFRMAVLRGRVEMYLDGRQIYYGPLDLPSPRLAVCTKGMGMTFEVRDWSIYELLDEGVRKVEVDPNVNSTYFHQQTRLHRAAARQTLAEVKQLVALGADTNARDDRGETPIQLAARYLRRDTMAYLLERGAPWDPLVAVGMGDAKRLEVCLKDRKDWVCPDPYTPLHVAATAGRVDCIQLLLEAGSDVNAQTTEPFFQRTPLMQAARYGHLEAVRLLVERGADVNREDSVLRTALDYAMEAQQQQVVQFLKEHNAITNRPTETPEKARGVRPPALPPEEEF